MTPKAQWITTIVFLILLWFCYNRMMANSNLEDERWKVLEAAAYEYDAIQAQIGDLKSPTYALEREIRTNIYKGKEEFDRRENHIAIIRSGNYGRYDSREDRIKLCNFSTAELSRMYEELQKLREKLVIAEKEVAEKTPPLLAKLEKIKEVGDFENKRFDSEVAKAKERAQSWALALVGCVGILYLICPPFKYFVLLIFAVCGLTWLSNKFGNE